MWDVEYTDEFEQWWETLSEGEHIDIAASVGLHPALDILTPQALTSQTTPTCVSSGYSTPVNLIAYVCP